MSTVYVNRSRFILQTHISDIFCEVCKLYNDYMCWQLSKCVHEMLFLFQIDTYCKSIGCVIAGYYQANEHLQDKE